MTVPDAAVEVAIRSVVDRYFFAADTGDAGLMLSCFAAPFRFELRLNPTIVLTTPDALRRMLRGFEAPTASNHGASNIAVTMTAAGATSITHATAQLYMKKTGKVLVRGLRYSDRWVRVGDDWRIAERLHEPRWQYDAPATEPAVALR
ncbi:nuclear transport factor 2 family protein [Sphingoaurantiacus capsulatus]|uniref:Nuclear transport factor 2 family protein n=1 Tax=Sphingoaurantiacus capsulatus TaxID=1771310 RepID=A0ABV7X8R6_9SPHN